RAHRPEVVHVEGFRVDRVEVDVLEQPGVLGQAGHLTFAPGWYTVQAFLTQTASTSPHRTFPVVSFEGEPLGQICLADLTRLTPQARANTRVESIARSAPTARPKDALTKVALGARLRPGRDLVLVTENGHAVGVVTQHDITRAVELRALGQDGRPAHR
ncbi:CBS domain-containing protein, partial [Kibdelosporangium lantanae]